MSKDNERLNLKEPDRIQVALNRILQSLVGNGKLIVGILAGLTLLALAWFGTSYYITSQDEGTKAAYTELEKGFDAEVKVYSDQLEAFEKDLDTLKLKEKSLGEKTDNALKKQISELEATIEDLKPDHSASKQKFLTFYETNAKSPSGMLAGIRYSALAIEAGESEKASSILEKIWVSSEDLTIIRLTAGLILARVHEDGGRFDNALAIIDQLLNTSEKAIKPRLLLTKGRLELLSGNKEKATQTLDELGKDYPNSQEMESAKSMKALLY